MGINSRHRLDSSYTEFLSLVAAQFSTAIAGLEFVRREHELRGDRQWLENMGRQGLVVELIGWVSSFILLLTLMRQVYTKWRTRATAGVSKWLFVGQLTASTGYIIYSYLLQNWVYVSSNIAILATALIGETIYLRNRKTTVPHEAQSPASASPRA